MEQKEKFYKKQWFMWLCLILFPPIGIALVWLVHKELSVKKRIIFSVISALWLVYCLARPNEEVSSDQNITTDSTTITTKNSTESNSKEYTYDALQQLYLSLSPDMTYTQALEYIKSTQLPYSEEKYNGSRMIQVSFTEGNTAQSYKKESGDYLELSFEYPKDENSGNDVLSKYTFGTLVYVPSDSSLTLISHNSGSYFSISQKGNYITSLGKTIEFDKELTKEEQLKYYFENK